MPKLKTRKGVSKRVRVTKKGKIKHFKAGRGHLLTGKRSKRKRALGRPALIAASDHYLVNLALPYGA